MPGDSIIFSIRRRLPRRVRPAYWLRRQRIHRSSVVLYMVVLVVMLRRVWVLTTMANSLDDGELELGVE